LKPLLLFALALAALPARADSSVPTPVAPGRGVAVGGIVRWKGPVPTPKRFDVVDDADACGPQRQSAELRVGSEGGVADTWVFVDDLRSEVPADPPRVKVTHLHCDYAPRFYVVPPGTVLDYGNDDKVLHNTHAYFGRALDRTPDESLFNVALPTPPHPRWVHALPGPGVVQLRCDVHPWESGTVIVTDHPYYALTDIGGRFRIFDVPPGRHTLVAWHSGWTTTDGSRTQPMVRRQSIVVGKSGEVTFELSTP
jgi:hypothetical protein